MQAIPLQLSFPRGDMNVKDALKHNLSVIDRIMDDVSSGRIHFLHVSLPKWTWSLTRKHDGNGPTPVRDCDHPHGLPCMNERATSQVNFANSLLCSIVSVMQYAISKGAIIVFEHPCDSYVWNDLCFAPSLLIAGHTPWCVNTVDFCQNGSLCQRSSKIVGWNAND